MPPCPRAAATSNMFTSSAGTAIPHPVSWTALPTFVQPRRWRTCRYCGTSTVASSRVRPHIHPRHLPRIEVQVNVEHILEPLLPPVPPRSLALCTTQPTSALPPTGSTLHEQTERNGRGSYGTVATRATRSNGIIAAPRSAADCMEGATSRNHLPRRLQ